MLLDYQAEAKELADQLGKGPPQGAGRGYQQWRAQALARMQELYGVLGAEGSQSDHLRQDQEAAARGEVPSWLQDRLLKTDQRGASDG